jgi:hypothetical protein
MRQIVAKVMTPSFEVAVNEYLSQYSDAEKPLKSRFEQSMVRDALTEVWKDNSNSFAKHVPSNLLQPETTEVVLEDVTEGLQSHTRVIWEGKVEKVCDIDSIVSYKRV